MKKLAILYLLFLATQLQAQYKYYKDSTYTTPFNYLGNGISINQGMYWDDDDFENIPIGFTFKIFNSTIDSLNLLSGNYFLTVPFDINNVTHFTGIMPSAADLVDRDTSTMGSYSPISYTTTGTAPNRIFKIEWANAGFYNGIFSGEYNDSTTFQIWLYENGHHIEIHYGASNHVSDVIDLYDGASGPLFAIFDSLDINTGGVNKFYYMNGNVANPYMDSLFNLNLPNTPGINGLPASGTVYRFSPKITQTGGTGYSVFTKQENYWIDYFAQSQMLHIDNLQSDAFTYMITDAQGALIDKGTIQKGRKSISTSMYAQGMYIVTLQSQNNKASYKFIK